jgi:hypothetical protein
MNTMNTTNSSSSAQRSRMVIALTIFAVLIVAGSAYAWHAGKQHAQTLDSAASSSTPNDAVLTSQLEAINSPNKIFTIAINGTKQVSGPTTIKVKHNDVVRVNINAAGTEEVNAHADELGLHTESSPEAGAGGGFSFVADTDGTFPYYSATEPDGNGNVTKVPLGKIIVSE